MFDVGRSATSPITTERPITLAQGTNVLVHNDPGKIKAEAVKALDGNSKKGTCPDIWDGHTAERIVSTLSARQVASVSQQ